MADTCKNSVVWNPVPAGSKLCAQSSAFDGANKSTNYNCTIEVDAGLGGPPTIWTKHDLDPGPAKLVLQDEGYGLVAMLSCFGPPVTLHVWVEPAGAKAFDCTWTNSTPGTVRQITIFIVAQAAA